MEDIIATLDAIWCSTIKKMDVNLMNKEFDYYELTSVTLGKLNATSTDKWLKQYPMEYNVAVEIWDSALLINATELLIDGQHFAIPVLNFKEEEMNEEKLISMLKGKYDVSIKKAKYDNKFYHSIIHSEYKKFFLKYDFDVIILDTSIGKEQIEELLKCLSKETSKPSSFIVVADAQFTANKEDSFYFDGRYTFAHFMFKTSDGWVYDKSFSYSGGKEIKQTMDFISAL